MSKSDRKYRGLKRREDKRDRLNKKNLRDSERLREQFNSKIKVWVMGGKNKKDINRAKTLHVVELNFNDPIKPDDLIDILIDRLGDIIYV